MRPIIHIICACLLICAGKGLVAATGPSSHQQTDALLSAASGADEVLIANNGISIPLGKLLLVRRGSEYCSVKFETFWTGKTENDQFAAYESWFQGDTTGNLSYEGVRSKRGKLHSPQGIWLGGGHTFSLWTNETIQCGPIRLLWSYRTWVYFFSDADNQGDFGIELAPTKWNSISEVNIFEPGLRWYRYDEKRRKVHIRVDELWQN